ncbi:MAG: apolipoprotein N-acyltransferase [Bacteroidia bacterium]
MKRLPSLSLSILSGALLGLAWLPSCTALIFFAFVPLLLAEENLSNSFDAKRKKLKLTGLSFLSFFIWNLASTWWIVYASAGGAAMAVFSNSFLMCTVFMLYHNAAARINKPWTIWLLIPLWMGFEYLHTIWDISWTWLTLGNVFAFQNSWVQWYEFTGTCGGTLWVLLVNILITKLILKMPVPKKELTRQSLIIIGFLAFPLCVSFFLTGESKQKAKGIDVMVVQPNVDPYNDKFVLEPEIQLEALLKQLEGKLDANVDYLVLPETFLTENIWESQLQESYSIQFLKENIIKKFPKLKIVSGANTLYAYKNEKPSVTARKFSNTDEYYDYFNSAIQIDSTPVVQIYHKSKLVPGVEKMPFPTLFKPLEKLAIDLGGTTGSLGIQEERTVFSSGSVKIAPVICYESVYGEFVGGYLKKGANLIFIVTNDGWWEDTPGYKHHLAYGALRAIETRTPIARSANTGISCFIDRNGMVSQATGWWEKAVIRATLQPNDELTFYVKYGDLLSKAATILAIAIILISNFLRFKKRWS